MAIENVVITSRVDPVKVGAAYGVMMAQFEDEEFNRAEVMAAAAMCLGTQWYGAVMDEDVTRKYIQDLMAWMAAYFAKGEVQ